MTNHDAYALGYAYGLLAAILPSSYDPAGTKYTLAQRRPLSGFATASNAARRAHLITSELDDRLAEILSEVDIDSVLSGGEDAVVPLPIQGSFGIGYYAGKSGKPFAGSDTFDIKAARIAKGLTQAQAAELLGVPQSSWQRWESGKVRPNAGSLAKIKQALE